jgi:hypothetical protein
MLFLSLNLNTKNMSEKEKVIQWVCEHPPIDQFLQLTNNGVNYDLIICRKCGKLVKKEPKEVYRKNVS